MSAPTASNLPAGRELDALVAEKVMGWRRCTCGIDGPGGCYYWWPTEEHGRSQPDFSTDIAAAWEVVEKLSSRFWARITTPFERSEDVHTGYWCGFTPLCSTGWNGRPDFESHAGFAPLAICLAALQAVGAGALLPPEDTKKVRGGGGSSGEPAQ